MHIQRICRIVIGVMLVVGATAAAAQENYEIRKISFSGNDSIPDEQLLPAMTIHPSNLLEKKVLKKEVSLYNADLLEREFERLSRFYQREGFADVKITQLPPVVNHKHKRIDLNIGIAEGQPYRIDSVAFDCPPGREGINTDSLCQRFAPSLSVQKGKRFRDEDLLADVDRLNLALRNKGFFYAESNYHLQLHPASHTVSVRFAVTPGVVCHFGKTEIEGNKHLSEKFIRKQIRWNEKDVYSSKKLEETRAKMYRLQLFSVLSVQPKPDSVDRTAVPVKMVIGEANRVNAKFGAGFGTEDRFRAFAEVTWKSLFGRARRLTFRVKHSALTPYDINLNWIQPQFLTTDLSLIINPYLSRIKEPGYEIRDAGANLKLSYAPNNFLTLNASYYLDRIKMLFSPISGISLSEMDYNKSGILLSSVFDNSSPRFSPTKGFDLLLAWKLNGYWFGGDFGFNRLWTDLRYYRSVGQTVLASRAMIGAVIKQNAGSFVPYEDRFYAGGSNSVRGWDRSMLGPVVLGKYPSGGASVLQGSFEWRVPVVWRISVVGFFDYGNVWEEELRYKLNDLSYACGGGLRLTTPIGPIRFDVGVPVWNEKRSAQFFISIGQAF